MNYNYWKDGSLCANCKWEVGVNYDEVDGIYRCGDCGSEIEGYEEESD